MQRIFTNDIQGFQFLALHCLEHLRQVPAALGWYLDAPALLEQTAENMEGLQRTLARGEDDRRDGTQALMALNERLGALAETMRTSQQLMLRLAETQASIAPALQKLGERSGDDVSRAHLRNIELILQRLITETEQGRSQSTTDLRNEIKILTRTIAAIAESEPR